MPNHTISKPPDHTPPEQLAYDFKSAAAAINVSPRSIARLVKRGEIPVSKSLRKKLITRQSLLDFLERTSR